MPKRKRDKQRDSDYDHLAKKLKKLERKMKHSRRRSKLTSSSESDNQSPRNSPERKSIAIEETYEENEVYSPGRSSWYDFSESVNEMPRGAAQQLVIADVHSPPADVPHNRPCSAVSAMLQSTVTAPEVAARAASLHTATLGGVDTSISVDFAELPSAAEAGPSSIPATTSDTAQINEVEQVAELDSDLMDILGEDPTCTREYGPDIQKDLAVRLNHITTSGLSKENRKDLKEKHLIPDNCRLMKAPSLNPEIHASLLESQAKRDKGIENKQNMTACALSSLSTAITMILSSENKNPELLKLLMDTARTLSDIQHSDSILRRYFILSTVKKDLKDQLEKTKIDEMLFGSNLSDTLKSAKTISKSGADIRSATTAKSITQTSNRTPGRSLNYRPPPASRWPTAAGAARRGPRSAPPPPPPPPAPTPRQTTTRPAPTQYSGFRPSWRQPHVRHRR